jgi:hypothetical protein
VPYPIWLGSLPFRDQKAQERGVQIHSRKALVWKIVFVRFVQIHDFGWAKTGHCSKMIGQGLYCFLLMGLFWFGIQPSHRKRLNYSILIGQSRILGFCPL